MKTTISKNQRHEYKIDSIDKYAQIKLNLSREYSYYELHFWANNFINKQKWIVQQLNLDKVEKEMLLSNLTMFTFVSFSTTSNAINFKISLSEYKLNELQINNIYNYLKLALTFDSRELFNDPTTIVEIKEKITKIVEDKSFADFNEFEQAKNEIFHTLVYNEEVKLSNSLINTQYRNFVTNNLTFEWYYHVINKLDKEILNHVISFDYVCNIENEKIKAVITNFIDKINVSNEKCSKILFETRQPKNYQIQQNTHTVFSIFEVKNNQTNKNFMLSKLVLVNALKKFYFNNVREKHSLIYSPSGVKIYDGEERYIFAQKCQIALDKLNELLIVEQEIKDHISSFITEKCVEDVKKQMLNELETLYDDNDWYHLYSFSNKNDFNLIVSDFDKYYATLEDKIKSLSINDVDVATISYLTSAQILGGK